MKMTWKAPVHPSIPSGVWTKVANDSKDMRKALRIHNENLTVNIRVSEQLYAPTLATEGLILYAGGDATITEDFDGIYTGPIYAYQSSGAAITSLAIQEAF